MFSILILFALIQLWLIFAGFEDFKEFRLPSIKAAITLFGLIFFNTEILSAFNAISSQNIILLWLAENLFLSGAIIFRTKFFKTDAKLLKNLLSESKMKVSAHKGYLFIIFLVYSVIFFIALVSAPNTVDSQTYHMARVANWIQWANVNFYPTSTLRQLYSNPLAEYGILNIFLLSGDDRFVNLLQFGSLIGCGVLVSLIVREFKLDYSSQIFAILLATTFPMAILQASSTQNDLVVSFFTLGFFLFYLRLSRSENKSYAELIFCALSLGLAFLTKGTAYMYCAVIGIAVFAFAFFSRLPRRKKSAFFLQSLLIVFIAISLNSIQYARNYSLFGSPVATGDESYVNKNLKLNSISAGIIKNYTIHLGTEFEGLQKVITEQTANLPGVEINNHEDNFLNSEFRIAYSSHEDDAGNFTHIILITISLFLLLPFGKKLDKNVLTVGIIVIVSFALLAVLLKWNPWLSRLHTPVFMLGCLIVAAVLSRMNYRASALTAILCLIGTVNVLLSGNPRSVLTAVEAVSGNDPRIDRYFDNSVPLAEKYKKAVSVVKENNPREVGLMLENDYRKYTFGDWEYPIWLMLKDDFSAQPVIRHVGLKNVSGSLTKDFSMPEWIITAGKENNIGGVEYEEILNAENIRVLKKK